MAWRLLRPLGVLAVGVVAGRLADSFWSKSGSNKDYNIKVLPCLQSLLQALQEYVERLRLEVDPEKWEGFVIVLLQKIDVVAEEIETLPGASDLNGLDGDVIYLDGLDRARDRVINVLDEELVRFLRLEPGVAFLLDSYLPRPGQTWKDFLQNKSEDEQHFYDEISADLFLQVKLRETLLESIRELKSSLEKSRPIDVGRGGDDEPEVITLTWTIIKVFFATDREVTTDAEYIGKIRPSSLESRVDEPLHFGWVEVGIPESHKPGTLEAPQHKEEAHPSKHIMVFSIDTNLRGHLRGFLDCVNCDLTKSKELGELLVYIHGYNVRHLKAVKRAAQLKNDLKFKGTVVLYSWSSKGTLDGYFIDQKNVEKTVAHLQMFLKSIMCEVKAPRAHVIAHSMGNRALIGALQGLFKSQKARQLRTFQCPLSQVILVAADEERSRFEKLVLQIDKRRRPISQVGSSNANSGASIYSRSDLTNTSSGSSADNQFPHLSVYCSTEDWPLALSRRIHSNKRRLGDVESLHDITSSNHVDFIDATGTEEGSCFKLHHSYHVTSDSVIEDIQVLLSKRAPASARTSHLKKFGCFYKFNRSFSSNSATRRCI